jgi:Protein of unknown function (DUF4012)
VRPSVEEAAGVRELADRTAALDQLMQVLPSMLGADEPPEYLVVFQNLAEARPTGGIVRAWALVDIAEGRPTLADDGANDDLALSQNVNLSPHFPQAAQLLSDLWVAQDRAAPDGVVSLDPAAFAALLQGRGRVDVAGGPSVTSDTLVDVVLRQVYEIYGEDQEEARTAYLSRLTGAVFGRVLDDVLAPGQLFARPGGCCHPAASPAVEPEARRAERLREPPSGRRSAGRDTEQRWRVCHERRRLEAGLLP